ncbi:MAG: PIN domain-containing protein [Chloroflexi bacterium]|nr:PIN domain-containing protein [Chloroflexota bacterium]
MVIYALEKVSPYDELAQHLLHFLERGFLSGIVSTVVETEVLVKPLMERNQLALDKAELFFRESLNLTVRAFDHALASRAAQVMANSRLRLPDAIILATGLEEHCDAVISNDHEMARRAIGIQCLLLDNYIS